MRPPHPPEKRGLKKLAKRIKQKEGGKRALNKKRPQNVEKKRGRAKKKIRQAGFEGTFGACLSIWPSCIWFLFLFYDNFNTNKKKF